MEEKDKLLDSSKPDEGKEPSKHKGETSSEDIPKSKHHKSLLKTRQQSRLDLVLSAKEKGLYTLQKALDRKSGPIVSIDGTDYKMLSSYDYLGLIGHPKIEEASIEAIKKFGTGSGGVRLLTGTNKLHVELEELLADFKGKGAAATFSSGYNANLAVLSALMDSSDVALVDNKIHQSTIDACKLAGLPFRRFKHNNHDDLERLLKQYRPKHRVVVISEGMFSMDGDICNLPEIVELKNKYDAALMIDEAHSLGVLGKYGKGVCSHFDISPEEIDFFVGSLSKAIPSNGGYVAASADMITFLQHGSSPYIFSAAMGPSSTAAATAAIKILQEDQTRHVALKNNTEFFLNGLKQLGYDTGQCSTPIIPVILGANEDALRFSQDLFENKILATPVIFPAVPKGQARLRLCVTAAQDQVFLEEALGVFEKLK